MQELPTPDQQRALLIELVQTRMPFGKYKDTLLHEIPEHYLVWFSQKGFPKGKLGEMLQLMTEIKANGLEGMIRKIAQSIPK